MLLSKSKLYSLLSCYIISLLLLVTYDSQIAAKNAYLGYHCIEITLSFFVVWFFSVLFIAILMPDKVIKPSDIFNFLYGVIILLPYVTLYNIRGKIDFLEYFMRFSILCIPFCIICFVSLCSLNIRYPTILNFNKLILLIVSFCLLVVFFALNAATLSAGFDFGNAYVRRLEGREIFATGTPQAYFNAMIINGFVPEMAFLSGWLKRPLLFFIALFCACAFFYILGLKAPVLFVVNAFLFGLLVRKGKIASFTKMLFTQLMLIQILSLIEQLFFGYSYIADYFIRRALTVPSWVISAFFEYMSSSEAWSVISGSYEQIPVSYVVGEQYLGMKGLNANTNAYIYQLASTGIIGYFSVISFVSAFFFILDSTYKNNSLIFFVSFAYSMLILEQAATTAMFSSGILFVTILALISRSNESQIRPFSVYS